MAHHPLDFSRTQRIVLLIDLHPLLHLQNPSPYLAAVLSSAETLLCFPPLSASLFAFRLFFSSLSPLLSSSKLHPFLGTAASSLSFHHPAHTLCSLSRSLNSLSPLSPSRTSNNSSVSQPPRASFVASSLLQLVHDYAWDNPGDEALGKPRDLLAVSSNLVVLFSPFPCLSKCLSEFMNVDLEDELLMNLDAFSSKFCEVFGPVIGAFVARDIHCCWVDIKFELECNEDKVLVIYEPVFKLGFLENGIMRLGWGLCSTESIVLGSALIPFELIYAKIAFLPNFSDYNVCGSSIKAQLILEILDVSGKPLECKCCVLELINLKRILMHRYDYDEATRTGEVTNSQTGGFKRQTLFSVQFNDGITKLHVKAVKRYDTFIISEGCLCDSFIVHVTSERAGNEQNESDSEFFADRVLAMLSKGTGELVQKSAVPIWQILLSFLSRNGYWALLSISNGNGNSYTGILKPFTIHSALISVIDHDILPPHKTDCLGDQNLITFDESRDKASAPYNGNNDSNDFVDSQCGLSSLKKNVSLRSSKSKKSRKRSHLQKDLSWSSFCKEVSEQSEMVLEELYFARGYGSSKKLKFLKCWMKQVKKSSSCSRTVDETQSQEVILKQIEDRLTESHQESEQPVSLTVSTEEDSLIENSRIPGGSEHLPHLETSEAFLSSLPEKIQHGLQSEQVDLGALAERLVNSSINFLYQKFESNANLENETSAVESDNECKLIVSEATKLLILEPKDLEVKHKASNPRLAPEDIVREYELQIFLRMEILRSVVAGRINESIKKKFVKQICALLDKIQWHQEGGFFGGASLSNYVERTIKCRYAHTLGDVVHSIYVKMDLLLFDSEDELPNPLLNSEDSNQPWRERPARKDKARVRRNGEQYSTEDESSNPIQSADESSQTLNSEEHSHRLIEAQERRQRARRFASFTSWMPDLQRVWAPKQPMAGRPKSDSQQKLLKKKDRRRSSYDTVCETPMTEKKRSCRRNIGTCMGEHGDYGFNTSGSVSKALFQDD